MSMTIYALISGMIAEEVLIACDEAAIEAGTLAGGGDSHGLANPAVHFFRLTLA